MGEKTHIHRFRPDSSSPLYGRKDPFPLISPRLCLPAIRPSSYFYGRKDPHPSISPRLFSITLWAKPHLSIHFAQTPLHLFMGEKTHIPRFRPDSSPSLYGRKDPHPPISPRLFITSLWAKSPISPDFAQTLPSRHSAKPLLLWAKRLASLDFAQTPLHLFMGETAPIHPFRPDSVFRPTQMPTRWCTDRGFSLISLSLLLSLHMDISARGFARVSLL